MGVAKCYVRREGRIKGDSRGIRSRRTSPNDRIPDIDEMKRTETNVLEFAMTSAARYRKDIERNTANYIHHFRCHSK